MMKRNKSEEKFESVTNVLGGRINLRSSKRLNSSGQSTKNDNLSVNVNSFDQEEHNEKQSLPISLPIEIFEKYLENKKKNMSRRPKGKSLSYKDSDPDYDPTTARKQRPKKLKKPNTDYAIIENPPNDEYFDNIYRTNTIVGSNCSHCMNTNIGMALQDNAKNDAGLPRLGLPFELPKLKLPKNLTVTLRDKYKILPNSIKTREKFGNAEKSNEQMPLNCTIVQNDPINLSTEKTVNPLNLTKSKDAEINSDGNIIANNEEKSFNESFEPNNIAVSSLAAGLANADSDFNNNSNILRNQENIIEIIDLDDDDDHDGVPNNIDPNILKTLQDQSEANKSFINLLVRILTKGHIIVANEVENTSTENILQRLHVTGVDVFKLLRLLRVCFEEYSESKTRERPLVANKSTETDPNNEIRPIQNLLTFQLTTPLKDGRSSLSVSTQTNESALQAQAKSVSQPHCPSQDVHSIIYRPSHQYNYSQSTNQNPNTVKEQLQIVTSHETPYAKKLNQTVVPQKNFASETANVPAIPAKNILINSSQPLPQAQNIFQLPQTQTRSDIRPYYNTQGSMEYQNLQQKQGSGTRSSQEASSNNSALRYGGHGRNRQSFNPCNPHNNVTAVTESSYSRHQNSIDPRFGSSQNAMRFYNQIDG